MRTTLTLDDDVAALLARVRQERALGMKDAINEALRVGLGRLITPEAPRTRYETHPFDTGRCLVGSLDDIADVLAIAEGESFR